MTRLLFAATAAVVFATASTPAFADYYDDVRHAEERVQREWYEYQHAIQSGAVDTREEQFQYQQAVQWLNYLRSLSPQYQQYQQYQQYPATRSYGPLRNYGPIYRPVYPGSPYGQRRTYRFVPGSVWR